MGDHRSIYVKWSNWSFLILPRRVFDFPRNVLNIIFTGYFIGNFMNILPDSACKIDDFLKWFFRSISRNQSCWWAQFFRPGSAKIFQFFTPWTRTRSQTRNFPLSGSGPYLDPQNTGRVRQPSCSKFRQSLNIFSKKPLKSCPVFIFFSFCQGELP